jgi:ABC-type multidrug transport system ATPase subunit
VAGVTKKFGDRVILEDLSLSIKEKETVVLIGSNGSGKSTAINMIVGFQRADQGDIVFGLSKST